MSQIKLPQISVTLKTLYGDHPNRNNQWTQINPSCVLAYLGLRGYGNLKNVTEKIVNKNGVPLLMYYDIFKNYYANTQEDYFYTIGGSVKPTITINGTNITDPDHISDMQGAIPNGGTIIIAPTTINTDNLRFTVQKNMYGRPETMTAAELGDIDEAADAWVS